MKDTQYHRLVEWTNVGGGLVPYNEPAKELLEQSAKGEVLTFEEKTERDLKFHRAYMSLLGFIYDYLPQSFQKVVPKNKFYMFLKHFKKEYEVVFSFKDGTQLVEYESIAFGSMSEKRFHEYIKQQMPFIYENIIGAYFEGEMYDNIVKTIEQEYEKFFNKL